MMTENVPEPQPQRYVIVGRDFPGPAPRFDALVRGQIELTSAAQCAAEAFRETACALYVDEVETVADYYAAGFDEHLSPDASSVRFSEMNEEAEAEMAEWDAIIKGKRKKPR